MDNLKNDHNVFILGAGFSAPAGLPVISNFLNKMRDAREYYAEMGNKDEVHNIDKVMKFRLEASSSAYRINIDLEDIEQLFSLASASNENISDSLKRAICSTIDFCQDSKDPVVRLSTRSDEGNVPFQEYLDKERKMNNKNYYKIPLYHHIAGIISGKYSSSANNTIISFNYDTLLENGLKSIGKDFTYSLKKNDRDKVDTIPILKLHGSINWGYDSNQEKLKTFSSYKKVIENNYNPLLIPPTWNKNFGKYLNRIWDKSIKYLSEATRIIFVGFSMPETDMHFKYLLASGLQKNISLRKIFVVDKKIDPLKKKEHVMYNNQPVKRVDIDYIKNGTKKFFGEYGIGRINRDLHVNTSNRH